MKDGAERAYKTRLAGQTGNERCGCFGILTPLLRDLCMVRCRNNLLPKIRINEDANKQMFTHYSADVEEKKVQMGEEMVLEQPRHCLGRTKWKIGPLIKFL